MTLTDFLLARIEDIETAARDVQGTAPWRGHSSPEARQWWMLTALADCEAKRSIVNRYLTLNEQAPTVGAIHRASFEAQAMALRVAVRFLAATYADHPDYLDEWRV